MARYFDRLHAWAAGKGYDIWRPNRRLLAVAYSCLLLSVLTIGSCITVPLVFDSWRYLKGVLLSDNPYVELANSIYYGLGAEATARVESLLATIFGEPSRAALNSLARVGEAPALTWQLQLSLKGYVAASLPFFNKILKGGSQVFAQVRSTSRYGGVRIARTHTRSRSCVLFHKHRNASLPATTCACRGNFGETP